MLQNFDAAYTKLKPEQREAVDSVYGPVLLLAGPGSGKTHVLTLRIANLLRVADVDPSNILALTFTETAASNMRERLRQFIGNAAYKVTVSTFHGFCNELIQAYRANFIFAREMRQIDDLTRIKILQEILDGNEFLLLKKYNSPYMMLSDISRAISILKKEGLTAERFYLKTTEHAEYLTENAEISTTKASSKNISTARLASDTNAPTEKAKYKKIWQDYHKLIAKNTELAEIYSQYESRLLDEGLYDYEDMILFVTRELNENPDFLADLQERYQFLLVDEYQDTNGAQNELLWNLTKEVEQPNIFAVGDDDQSIYSFQGANLRNILEFVQNYQGTKIITTKYNFRSRQEVLDVAQASISNNSQRFVTQYQEEAKELGIELNKQLIAGRGLDLQPARDLDPKPIILSKHANQQQELDQILTQIESLTSAGVAPESIAVIYRKHADGLELAKHLQAQGILTNSAIGNNVLQSTLARQLLGLFKWLQSPTSSSDLLQILHWPNWQLSTIDLYKILRHLGTQYSGLELLDILISPDTLHTIGIENVEQITALANKLLGLRQVAMSEDLPTLFLELIEQGGFLESAMGDGDTAKLLVLNRLQKFLIARSRRNSDYKVSDLLLDLESMREHGLQLEATKLEANPKGVNLMSAHSAKGLEFDYVFLIRCTDGNWGNRRVPSKLNLLNLFELGIGNHSLNKEDAIEEERRLFFVALTRARAQLYISYSQSYYNFEQDKLTKAIPSMYLEEVSPEYTTIVDNTEAQIDPTVNLRKLSPLPEIVGSNLREFLFTAAKELRLSFSAFNTYLECPQRFLYEYILRIPKSIQPSMVLGLALHYALEKFNSKRIELLGKQSNDSAQLGIVELNLLVKQYIATKDLPEAVGVAITQEAEKVLSEYYPEIMLANAGKIFAAEYSFSHRLNFEGIALTGKIDLLIEDVAANSEKHLQIVDYKSGEPASRNALLGVTKSAGYVANYHQQLIFYKLLVELDPRFSQKQLVVNKATLVFLRPNKSGKFKSEEFVITPEEVSTLKLKIKVVHQKIMSLEFNQACQKESCGVCSMLVR